MKFNLVLPLLLVTGAIIYRYYPRLSPPNGEVIDYYPIDTDQLISLSEQDLPTGWYQYEMDVNYVHISHERGLNNNLNRFWIFTNRSLVESDYINCSQLLVDRPPPPEGGCT